MKVLIKSAWGSDESTKACFPFLHANAFAEAGHEVYSIMPEQLALWRKAAEPLTQAWADGVRKVGYKDPDAMLGELKAELGKYKAAY